MKHFIHLTLIPLFLAGAGAIGADKDPAPFYSVPSYDAKRDPFADLQTSIEIAKQGHRRILLVAGGDWCGWCRRMENVFHKAPAVTSLLTQNYVVMKVNYSNANQNSDFFSKYPDFPEFPYFFVLSEDGELLHAQNPVEWEKLGGYDVERVAAFFRKWAPEPAS